MTSSDSAPAITQSALFICTGNFHRSRFAEHLFNAVARERGLRWTAISRGTNVEGSRTFFRGRLMSPEAQQALDELSIEFRASLRDPLQLTHDDLAAADVIVAVCEEEHRPHIERDFLAAAERVHYWGVFDVPIWPAADGLAAIQRLVHNWLTSSLNATRLKTDRLGQPPPAERCLHTVEQSFTTG